MRFVSRAVLVLRARQPYVDWANSLAVEGAGSVSLEEARTAGSAFLVPPFERDEDARGFIESHAGAMLEHELGMWEDDPSTWPPVRDAQTLRDWFDIEVHDIVVDLGEDEIATEELG